MTISSPGKVNLFLRIVGKRDDGYHNIETLFTKISLCDELRFTQHVEKQETAITLSCPGHEDLENQENLIVRAAHALAEYCQKGDGTTVWPSEWPGIHIQVNKSIPAGGGLAGGSSNAATTLLTLNEILQLRLTQRDLHTIGSKIGADVPFFLGNWSAAYATGTGVDLRKVELIDKASLLLVHPGFAVSTPWAYSQCNLLTLNKGNDNKIDNISTRLSVEALARVMENHLEAGVFKQHPILQDLKNALINQGALGALMSGSGSCVFGVFTDDQKAKDCLESLDPENYAWAKIVQTC